MTAVPQPHNDALISFAGRDFSQFAVQNNIHCIPIDEIAEEQSDELNRILGDLLGRVVLPRVTGQHVNPLDAVNEPAVLDCGFGKGAWIDDLLKEQGDAVVTGVDVNLGRASESDEGSDEEDEDEDDAIEEFIRKRWNLNASFRTDRSSSRMRPETFDLINSRLLADGIDAARWPSYVSELKLLLKPGGWLQMVEMHLLFQSNNGQDTRFLQNWNRWYADVLQRMGKDPRVGRRLGQLMTAAGFHGVQQSSVRLPIGRWATNQTGLGLRAKDLFHKLIRSYSVWPFLRSPGGMQPDQYRALIGGAQNELESSQFQLYIDVHVAYGYRPRR